MTTVPVPVGFSVERRQRGPLYLLHLREMVRNRSYFVFVAVFPFGMMGMFLLLDAVLGQEPDAPDFGPTIVPMAVFLAVTGVALTMTAGPLAQYRERGTLRVLSTTPVSRREFIVTHLVVRAVASFVLSAAVIVVGALLDLVPWGSIVRLVPAVVGGLAVFLGIGYVLGGIVGSGQLATNLSTLIQVPALFLSGAAVPYSILPAGLASVLGWLPTSQLTDLVFWATRSPAQVHPWGVSMVVSLAAGAVAVLVAIRAFRWDNGPR